MIQYRFEIDGDSSDYADCFYNVFAKNLKEAFQKWNERDGRRVKSYQVVKVFSNVEWH